MTETKEIFIRAKQAARDMLRLSTDEKNRILSAMASSLTENASKILYANSLDITAAKGKISDVMLDRLFLDEKRIASMRKGMEDVISLPDPVGEVISEVKRGTLIIEKVLVPLGVVGIIYESRPNVTSDAACLCLKSGNVCILRSGKEAFRTAKAIVDAMREAIKQAGFNENFVNIIEDTTRESANEMMTATGFIDLLIPRGGKGLIRACVENATVPCIETGTGICHIYIEKSADLDMALDIVENAKTSRPSVCNACEVILVDESIAQKFLPMLEKRLIADREKDGKTPVRFKLDPKFAGLIAGDIAGKDDFDTEFLDYILAVKAVSGIEEALSHIALHSTHHSEAIITEDQEKAAVFLQLVDSTSVYHNASTRFTDGGEFGLGCEMGISTQKLHARGPMGLRELCTYKYKIHGNGNVR